MPLRDHFPKNRRPNWEPVHGMWPVVIVQHLIRTLSPRYQVHPKIHLGSYFEIDIGAVDSEPDLGFGNWHGGSGGTMTAALPRTSIDDRTELADDRDEYEVNITDLDDGKLVAVIELISPSNKDRADRRADFVTKCETLLKQGVCVTLVDPITCRDSNLYTELLARFDRRDQTMSADPPAAYAATAFRQRLDDKHARFRTWASPLAIGQPLPTLPVWVNDTDWVTLDLEATYEETCQTLWRK